MVRLMKQANVFPLKKTLKKFIIWEINSDKGILKEDFQASKPRKFQFLNENFAKLLMKNKSKFFAIYIHQTMHNYLDEHTHTHIHTHTHTHTHIY